jgi:hypothetical protein
MTEVAHGSSGFACVNGGRLLTSRPYAEDTDLSVIVALIDACEAVDNKFLVGEYRIFLLSGRVTWFSVSRMASRPGIAGTSCGKS